ncbi:hypothetical protein DT23_14945 [Thioclava indica]|uniref:Uncharacterized protein n=1 Tax=Thioclava indica TaxID=1353528 RepID=A0A074JU84_9RHOB|nr:hypothetical protein DT23_14945 [Thioclava indica]
MTWNSAIRDFGRTLTDHDLIGHEASSLTFSSRARDTQGAARAQASDQFASQRATALNE